MNRLEITKRSLWVQGYTGFNVRDIDLEHAFPVGTGIYRLAIIYGTCIKSVPCGYRDIPPLCCTSYA